MDRHPVFSTALIARRCFASKSASNEYHFGRPGIPVTLRELEEKMMRDVTSLDHFQHIAKVMVDRMVAAVKGEFAAEAKIIKTEVEKLLKGINEPVSAPPAAVNNTAKSKKGSNKENNAAKEQEEAKANDKKNAKVPAKGRETRRGKDNKETSVVQETKPVKGKKAVANAVKKDAKKTETEKTSDPENTEADKKCQKTTTRNRRAKKQEDSSQTAAKKSKQQNENLPNIAVSDDAEGKSEEEKPAPEKPATEAKVVAPAAPEKGKGRKRKNANALAPVNSNSSRGGKVQKTATVAAKIIAGSPGSPAKIAIAGNNLVSSLSQPLPPHVVLPTTPVAASQVQTIKSSAPPPPQVIQLRPTGTLATTMGTPTASMQIRPLRAGAPTGARPQFFKIVGGTPVQISNVQRLPGGALQPPPGSRVVYMRAPVPATSGGTGGPLQITSNNATSSTTTTSTTSSGAVPTGNKIILLSNKGQPIPVSKGAVVSGAPSIVRIVSPSSLTSGMAAGGKLKLTPASPNSPTKMATLRPASGATGPILLRTVAPRPTVGSPPIQLPMAPLPKSALTSNSDGGKKTAVSGNDTTAKAIQVLLPKNPLPPSTVQGNLSPQKSPPMAVTTTTTTTTPNGAFVWTNSTRANFKLSSRIHFASLDQFKNVVNKDVHFILASIVTEDKSNEFSFRLHLKREPVPAGKKGQKASAEQQSYLELVGKAKVPTAQEWSLKVKTEPPVFLVSKGNFLADNRAVKIPKDISDKPFVDYELHIDKCSPMQVATSNVAQIQTAATPKRGRKAAAAK